MEVSLDLWKTNVSQVSQVECEGKKVERNGGKGSNDHEEI